MKAHNSVLIDEQEYSLPKDSWRYTNYGIPCKPNVRHIGNMHYMEGVVIGHEPLQLWTRKIILIDPSICIIIDEMKEDGVHTFRQRFHVEPDIHIVSTNTGWVLNDCLQVWNPLQRSIEVEPCSLRYNELLDHSVLHTHASLCNGGEVLTCFCPKEYTIERVPVLQNLDTPIEESFAQAIKCTLSETERYTIIIFHKELYTGKKSVVLKV